MKNNKRSIRHVELTNKHHTGVVYRWTLLSVVLTILFSVAAGNLGMRILNDQLAFDDAYQAEYMLRRVQILTTVVLFTLSSLSAIAALIIYSAHRISGPYQALRRALCAVRDGNLDHELHFRGYDELADVADCFNEMTHALKERMPSG